MTPTNQQLIRIAVISDTHGKIKGVEDYLDQHGPFDLVLHAGDFTVDLYKIIQLWSERTVDNQHLPYGYYSVSGNCDEFPYPKELMLNVGGIRFLILHGHESGVKSGLMQLKYQALEEKADAVIFGHTHIPVNIKEQGILYFNPGSVSQPRGGSAASFGILELGDKKIINSSLIYV